MDFEPSSSFKQVTATAGMLFDPNEADFDYFRDFPSVESAPKGVFDLFGEDVELQEAENQFGYASFAGGDGTDQMKDTTSLNSDPTRPHSFSNVNRISSSNNVSGIDSGNNINRISSAESVISNLGGRARLPKSAKDLLDKWIDINKAEPYLKPNDAEAFAQITGITAQQVKTYVANSRARKMSCLPLPSQSSAASLTSYGSNISLAPRRGRRAYRASSAASLHSSVSQHPIPAQPVNRKRYRCTWVSCAQTFGCAQVFDRKSDWKRHEETIHVPQEEWICMPSYPATIDEQSGYAACSFCSWTMVGTPFFLEGNVTTHLSNEHNYRSCFEKSGSDRTFVRKDKLVQHLRQVHGQKHPLTESQRGWWRLANVDARYICPFCGVEGMSWVQRVDHVAEHFENGDTVLGDGSADTDVDCDG